MSKLLTSGVLLRGAEPVHGRESGAREPHQRGEVEGEALEDGGDGLVDEVVVAGDDVLEAAGENVAEDDDGVGGEEVAEEAPLGHHNEDIAAREVEASEYFPQDDDVDQGDGEQGGSLALKQGK